MSIKNEETFLEKVEESAITKVRIDEEYKPEYTKLKKLFKMAFGVKPVWFKFLSDLQYYKGGYPKETTEPKIKKLLDSIGNAYNFYELREQENVINGYLRATYGIEIKATAPSEVGRPGIKKLKKFSELFRDTFNEDYKLTSKKDLVNKLLEAAISLEDSICKDNDEVRVTNAEYVEAECEVKKTNFMAAVGLKVSGLKKGEEAITDKLNDINAKREEFDQVADALVPNEGE